VTLRRLLFLAVPISVKAKVAVGNISGNRVPCAPQIPHAVSD